MSMLAAEGSTSPGKGASHGYLDVHKRPESTADAIMLLNRVEGQDGKEEAWDTRSTSPPRVSIDSTPRPATSFQLPTFEDLLFDLLFAAVLNVYSASMSFDRARQIAAFAAFFAILWWAWFTQTLFDVRYRQRTGRLRSVAQGVLRFVLLCVWLGFTTVPSEFTRSGFATATLLYALTRVCLILDFALVWSLDPSLRCDPQMRLGTCVIVAASTISAIMWGVSRLFDDNFGVVWQQGVMWGLAILLEVVAQSYTELTLRFGPLGDTILAERMATFGLIILGEGFNSLGDVLNGFSIGAHQWGGDGSPAGGWGRGSILQTLSSVITLLMQFYAYFSDASRELDLPPLAGLSWSYMHLILHLASLVTVVGLKKVVGFLNAMRAIEELFDNPRKWLPDYPPWNELDYYDLYAIIDGRNETMPAHGSARAHEVVLSMFTIIEETLGSQIPSAGQAAGLRSAAKEMASISLDPPLRLVLSKWDGLSQAISQQNSSSLNSWIEQNLLQTKFLYGACAIFLAADAIVKILRGLRTRAADSPRPRRRDKLGWIFRLGFAVVLTAIQAVFIAYGGPPSDQALTGTLAILASVLLAEFIVSLVVREYCRRKSSDL